MQVHLEKLNAKHVRRMVPCKTPSHMLAAETKNAFSRSCGFLTLTSCGSLAPTLVILTPLPQSRLSHLQKHLRS